jgi:hypothetical protein
MRVRLPPSLPICPRRSVSLHAFARRRTGVANRRLGQLFSARSSIGLGCSPFKAERWVRFPYGLPFQRVIYCMIMDKEKACFCVPSTSNERDWKSFDDTYLNQILCRSLECKTNDYDIDIYIGYDSDDKLYSQIELPKTHKGMNLIWKSFVNEKGNPCKIWTELSKEAVKDNHDYFMVCGDDIVFDQNDKWIKVFIDQLKRNNNIGYSAGWSNNDNIPTQFMFHKTHLDIFGFVYPPQIHNWYCDSFIHGLYGKQFGNWMKEYKHLNTGGRQRYKPKNDKKLCELLIKRYKKTLPF